MFDFQLDDKGDIILDSSDDFKNMRIRFFVPSEDSFASQRISFFTGMSNPTYKKPKGQRITFRFLDPGALKKAKEKNLELTDEAAQNIALQFRSELYGSKNDEIGSSLYKHRHSMIASERDLDIINQTAQRIVDDILPGAIVKTEEKEDSRAGYFSFQALRFTVYYKEKTILEYVI